MKSDPSTANIIDLNLSHNDFSMSMEVLLFLPCCPQSVFLVDIAQSLFGDTAHDNVSEVVKLIDELERSSHVIAHLKRPYYIGKRWVSRPTACIDASTCGYSMREAEGYYEAVYGG